MAEKKYGHITITWVDGNAHLMLGLAVRELRRIGADNSDIDELQAKALAGANVKDLLSDWFNVVDRD